MQTASSPVGRRTQTKAILGIMRGQDHPIHRHAHVPPRKLGSPRGFPGAGLASEGLKAPPLPARTLQKALAETLLNIKTRTHPTLVPAVPIF